MDLNEAGQRIFKHHWVLIALVTVLGLVVAAVLVGQQGDTYASSARLTIGGPDTPDAGEATSLADTALGLATSSTLLDQAIADTGASRDKTEVMEHLSVAPVGTSGVLQLTVTDSSPEVAQSLAGSLAAAIVAERSDVLLGGTQDLLAQTDEQIDDLTQSLAGIEAERAALPPVPVTTISAQAAAAAAAASAAVTALDLRRQEVLAQRGVLESQRQELNLDLVATGTPRLLDESASPGTAVSSAGPARIALGALLGLIIGVAIAAVREALRPTLGRSGVARHFGVPLLGRLARRPDRDTELTDSWLPTYLAAAAKDAGVQTVQLVPAGRGTDVVRLASWLDESDNAGLRVVPFALNSADSHDENAHPELDEPGVGVVVVAPDVIRDDELADPERYATMMRRPVIGVVTYGSRRGRHRSPGRGAAPAPVLAGAHSVEAPAHSRQEPATDLVADGPGVDGSPTRDSAPAASPAS